MGNLQFHSARTSFGAHLQRWRRMRHLSQLMLSEASAVSPRHISFLESGRATPSREMVLRLCDRLDVPHRERNTMLSAAGFAAMYRERSLQDVEMTSARKALELILRCHEPFPALVMDRHWNMVMNNSVVSVLLDGVAPQLLVPPINVVRMCVHPQGLAHRIENAAQWKRYMAQRLRSQLRSNADPILTSLLQAVNDFDACDRDAQANVDCEFDGIVMPFVLRTEHATLTFISTMTVFGSPVDITLQELALESFLPADDSTAEALRRLIKR